MSADKKAATAVIKPAPKSAVNPSATNKTLVLKPRVSEKSYGLSKSLNTYVFEVPSIANKAMVADAVTEQFKVTVETVNIIVSKGKAKRTYRRGGRPVVGKDSDVKKAYVRLKVGDEIPVFAAMDENAEADKKEKK
jgi:large subunit ribosomal protein L23